jgi:creatinine amidohydrolase
MTTENERADPGSPRLDETSWRDVADGEASVALLPVGSTEQHGPHAPLGTDTLTATTVAERAADRYEQRTGREVLVAPAIPVGIAAEHRAFDGTLWVSPDTFRSYLREVAESLLETVDRVVFVNGHGGNSDALTEVADELTRADRDAGDGERHVAAFTWFEALEDYPAGMGHGGPIETAAVRAIAPEFIDDGRLDEAAAGASETWGEWSGGVNLAPDSHEFTESGVVGDPREGDVERGEAVLEEGVDALVTILLELEARSVY